MICSHLYDFVSGATIALPHPTNGKPSEHHQWDIVRPNESAEQMVLRHLETLKALKIKKSKTQKALVPGNPLQLILLEDVHRPDSQEADNPELLKTCETAAH